MEFLSKIAQMSLSTCIIISKTATATCIMTRDERGEIEKGESTCVLTFFSQSAGRKNVWNVEVTTWGFDSGGKFLCLLIVGREKASEKSRDAKRNAWRWRETRQEWWRGDWKLSGTREKSTFLISALKPCWFAFVWLDLALQTNHSIALWWQIQDHQEMESLLKR